MIVSVSQDQISKIGSRKVLVSISGGKDSAALALWLKESGIPFESVFMDTGWESEKTEQYLKEVLPRYVGEIRWLKSKYTLESLILSKKMFPSSLRRFCTTELKLYPLRDYIASLDVDVVNANGVRAEESKARGRLSEWEWSEGLDCDSWRPLLKWSEQDVIDMHQRHGLPPNPLYLEGSRRVGCWPCIFSHKEQIRQVAKHDPARIDRIRELERAVYESQLDSFKRRGDPPPPQRGFLQMRSGKICLIDDIVAWSRTEFGGRQLADLLPDNPSDMGCMRWGLCEGGSR